MMPMKERIEKIESQKRVMLEYLKLKMQEEDWHGCQDAASDLRDIEIEKTLLLEFYNTPTVINLEIDPDIKPGSVHFRRPIL